MQREGVGAASQPVVAPASPNRSVVVVAAADLEGGRRQSGRRAVGGLCLVVDRHERVGKATVRPRHRLQAGSDIVRRLLGGGNPHVDAAALELVATIDHVLVGWPLEWSFGVARNHLLLAGVPQQQVLDGGHGRLCACTRGASSACDARRRKRSAVRHVVVEPAARAGCGCVAVVSVRARASVANFEELNLRDSGPKF